MTYITSIFAFVVPAILITFFFISIVEKVEKNTPVKWRYLLIALVILGATQYGHYQGYQKAIEDAQLVEVQGYVYILDFDGELHEYAGDCYYTK